MTRLFSPAPWTEVVTDDGDLIVKMDKSHEVLFGNIEGTCGTCHANATLTRLAPELLEALERLIDKYSKDALMPIDWYHAMQVLKQIKMED